MLRLGHPSCHVQDVGLHGWVNVLKHGYDVEPNLVALNVGNKVGAVRDIILSYGCKVSLNLASVHTEQRPDNQSVAWCHARKPVQSRAACDVKKNGLNIVILMMGHAYRLGIYVTA